jgi:hypothetical protein
MYDGRADFIHDEEIREHMAWESPFRDVASGKEVIQFTQEEKDAMLRLPRKEC